MRDSAGVVICGAGIGGIAVAYFLANRFDVTDVILVDERPPLSLTSDKSTECYRNWWPGPGNAMVCMMNRSLDLLEELAESYHNCFHLNCRGYLYTTSDLGRICDLEGFGREAESLGAGKLRIHDQWKKNDYQPHSANGYKKALHGADLITDQALIRKHFPYLSEQIVAVMHVRRAGWLSAQQYGMLLLEEAKKRGLKLVRDQVTGVRLADGCVSAVLLASGKVIQTEVFVNAAGPLLAEVGAMLGVDLPVHHELHHKSSIEDTAGAVGRDAPLLIDIDRQFLTWQEEEREWLVREPDTAWLLEEMPSGAHLRPEGSASARTVLMLWDLHNEKVSPELPAPVDDFSAEVSLRGLTKMLPGMQTYHSRMPKPYIDSGYYTKTEENRPLAGKMGVPGAYLIGAMSGFGIMASAALGELTAAHIAGAPLPDYGPAFSLDRYQDPAYQALLADWGGTWQL
ncbi:MAG: FAD-binding oxidoreductase [Anaerolineales bacterium]|nr:FAD-binding oxidoreductase [Anaerolineales bacterium]